MEQEAPGSHEEIPNIRNEENGVVPILPTTQDPLERQPHKQKIRQGIDNLSRINRGIVVL